jgi:hypothetical protein
VIGGAAGAFLTGHAAGQYVGRGAEVTSLAGIVNSAGSLSDRTSTYSANTTLASTTRHVLPLH